MMHDLSSMNSPFGPAYLCCWFPVRAAGARTAASIATSMEGHDFEGAMPSLTLISPSFRLQLAYEYWTAFSISSDKAGTCRSPTNPTSKTSSDPGRMRGTTSEQFQNSTCTYSKLLKILIHTKRSLSHFRHSPWNPSSTTPTQAASSSAPAASTSSPLKSNDSASHPLYS